MNEWTREPVVSGTFYTSDEKELQKQLSDFCVFPGEKRSVRAIVAPHAGYAYSGAIAGKVYGQIKIPPTVVVLCPNHTGRGKRISIWDKGSWLTPLGEVLIETDLASKLLTESAVGLGDRDAHRFEHAIEVHVPFLQMFRPDVRIVPVVLGPLTLDQCSKFGDALYRCTKDRPDVLVVASTDMSHFIDATSAKRKDSLALKAVESLSASELYETVLKNEISMCGFIPTTCQLFAAARWGLQKGEILAYGNSGETTGDFSSVVGYAAAWLI